MERDGDIVRAVRKRRGWTLVELEDKSGISQPTLDRLESNDSRITFETLRRVATPLGIDIDFDAQRLIRPGDMSDSEIEAARKPDRGFSADGWRSKLVGYVMHRSELEQRAPEAIMTEMLLLYEAKHPPARIERASDRDAAGSLADRGKGKRGRSGPQRPSDPDEKSKK